MQSVWVSLVVLLPWPCPSLLALEFCGGRDSFAQGDYFVAMGMNLISSEPQLLRKTLGI